jgi:hypothetical protein
MFFSLSRLYLTLTSIKTNEFSTLGRYFLKRVRFRYVTNHLIRRHYRVCSPAVCILCGINSKHSDILKKKGGYILKIITKLYVTRNDDTTSFCYKSLKTILVVMMMMMIWNILRMLLTI